MAELMFKVQGSMFNVGAPRVGAKIPNEAADEILYANSDLEEGLERLLTEVFLIQGNVQMGLHLRR